MERSYWQTHMKTLLLAALGFALLAGSAFAGRVGVFVNAGGGFGCGPRFYAPPACYAPRVLPCYPAPVFFVRSAPAYYCSPSPVIYVPAAPAPIYRAPIVTGGVDVRTVSFGWRR